VCSSDLVKKDKKIKKAKKVKKKKKKKKTKYEYVVDEIYSHFRSDQLSYYHSKKSRMRRLLKRMYDEDRLPLNKIVDGVSIDRKKYIFPVIQTMSGWVGTDKSILKTAINAELILKAFDIYRKFRNKSISKAKYRTAIKKVLGFVP